MFRTLTMTAIAAVMAAPVYAEGVNYSRLSYDYTDFSNGDADVSFGVFQGDVEYEVNQFLLSADVISSDFDGDLTVTTYSLGAGYAITPEVLAGLGLTGAETDLDGVDGINGIEGYAQYQTAQFGVGINVAQFDTDEDNVITSLYGEYEVSPGVILGATTSTDSEEDGTAYILSAEYDAGPIDARAYYSGFSEDDVGVFGVRGTYEVTPQFRAGAAFDTFVGDDAPELDSFVITGGYKIIEGLWVDADYGQINFDDDFDDSVSVDRFQLALTYEVGAQKRIDNRFAQDNIDDIQAGVGAIVPFF